MLILLADATAAILGSVLMIAGLIAGTVIAVRFLRSRTDRL